MLSVILVSTALARPFAGRRQENNADVLIIEQRAKADKVGGGRRWGQDGGDQPWAGMGGAEGRGWGLRGSSIPCVCRRAAQAPALACRNHCRSSYDAVLQLG